MGLDVRVAAFKRFSHCTTLAARYYIPSFFRGSGSLSHPEGSRCRVAHRRVFNPPKIRDVLLKRQVWISFESFSRQPTTTVANSPTGGAPVLATWREREREKAAQTELDRRREESRDADKTPGREKEKERERRERSILFRRPLTLRVTVERSVGRSDERTSDKRDRAGAREDWGRGRITVARDANQGVRRGSKGGTRGESRGLAAGSSRCVTHRTDRMA